MDHTADQPSFAWLRGLNFKQVQGATLHLELTSGERNRLGFVQSRAEMLAEMLTRSAGQRVQVRIDAAAGDTTEPARPTRQAGPTQEELDAAMQLPLTRQAAELFNGRPINVRPSPNTPPPTSDTDPAGD